MSAQEDQLPTDGQPTQAQDAPDPGKSKPSTPRATTGGPSAGDPAAAERPASDQGASDPAQPERGTGDAGRMPARRPTRGRRRGNDGRYVRAYRGFELSLQDFRDELPAIAADVSHLLRNESVVNPELKAQLEQRVERLRGTVSMLAQEAAEAGDRLRADVEDEVQARVAAARDAVVERPITSVAMAAVIGMSVGMLLSRRR